MQFKGRMQACLQEQNLEATSDSSFFFFFFFNLVCIPVMKLWCELPDVRGKTVESELSRRQFPPFLRALLSSYYTPVAVPSAGTSHARVGPSGRAGRAASTLASLLIS